MTLGRRSRYSPEVHRLIIKYAEEGIPRKRIAPLVGVGVSTLMHWLDLGRKGEEPYAQLVADLEPAEQMLIAKSYEVLRNKVFRGDLKAALRTLEAYDPERWGRQQNIRVINWAEATLRQARDEGWDTGMLLKLAEWLEGKIEPDRIAEFIAAGGLRQSSSGDSPEGDEGNPAEPDDILPE